MAQNCPFLRGLRNFRRWPSRDAAFWYARASARCLARSQSYSHLASS